MDKDNRYRFNTRVVHEAQHPEQWQGATQPPVFQTASHRHDTAESLQKAFAGRTGADIYMRLTNPTNRALEEKLASLENGAGAVAMASGMAAVTNTCMALLRQGDTFVAGRSLFMSTYVLFTKVFKKYGLTEHLVDPADIEAAAGAIDARTRFVYLETIGNPAMDVPDIRQMADMAHNHGLPLVVDNTLATPYLCCPIDLGADVVIHSTTKYFSGHGHASGGVVIDAGNFDWSQARFPDLQPFVERRGRLALLDKIWREQHINFGTTQAPFHSFLTFVGLDTLGVRMERHLANAQKVALFLNSHPAVAWVNYPGLPGSPFHETALRQFEGKGFGGVLTFGLKDEKNCFRFINRLRLINHLANLGDCKTLVIHPWSTQYVSFDDITRQSLYIRPEMVRLSVGIEAVEDIIADIDRSLAGLD